MQPIAFFVLVVTYCLKVRFKYKICLNIRKVVPSIATNKYKEWIAQPERYGRLEQAVIAKDAAAHDALAMAESDESIAKVLVKRHIFAFPRKVIGERLDAVGRDPCGAEHLLGCSF